MDGIDVIGEGVTFAYLLTAAGVAVAGVIIATFVELLKRTFPTLDARVSGALMAFVSSAVLYILAGIAVGVNTLDEGLVVFLSWLATATASVGIYATAKHTLAQT